MTRPVDIPEQVYERAAILMDQLRDYDDDLEYTARLLMAVEKPEPRPHLAGITPLQSKVMTFIDAYQAKHRYSPTYDEIKDAFGLRSKSGVHRIIHALVERGAIRILPSTARSIQLVGRA